MLVGVSASPSRKPLSAPPRARRRRNPWVRAGLAAAVVVMLPFAWSEDATCDHLPHPAVSGYQILFGKGWEPGALFFGLLVVSVGLGFLARATLRVWLRLAGEVMAGLAGFGSLVMCGMMMTYGRPEQPLVYPAAWIGVTAAVVLAFEAWWATGEALRRGVEQRRATRALAREAMAAKRPPVRIAEARDRGSGEGVESDVVAEAEAMAEEEERRPERTAKSDAGHG
jgi:hypothetical protein